jgi:hypothetical protein
MKISVNRLSSQNEVLNSGLKEKNKNKARVEKMTDYRHTALSCICGDKSETKHQTHECRKR